MRKLITPWLLIKEVISIQAISLKNLTSSNKYSVRFKILTPNGKFLSDSLKGILYNSNNTLSETKILSDNIGGSYVFWLENLNQKTVLTITVC